MLRDLNVELHKPTSLFCDNQLALYIEAYSDFPELTKHIEIDCQGKTPNKCDSSMLCFYNGVVGNYFYKIAWQESSLHSPT